MKIESYWKRIGLFPHHGISLPLSSLRSHKSCGVGEFFDLFPLIDWCKKRGFDCIQLLPLNDTGTDTSPYNAISSCALDPIYLSLSAFIDAGDLVQELSLFSSLNQLPRLNRQEVKDQKLKWLRLYFTQKFPTLSETSNFQEFVAQNSWLKSYALFVSLIEEYGHDEWQNWPQEKKEIDQNILDFHFFVQYLCFSQLTEVYCYATTQAIFLKGDVPFLLSRKSADVWAEQDLFELNFTAGAPPDYHTPFGQNWNFPLFNWENLRRTNFAWWKQRLSVIKNLYHLYRIDHIIGFFKVWAIPLGKIATDGFFLPADPSIWKQQGEEILNSLLDSCDLFPIAEDLVSIPDEIYSSLRELGICGTKLVRLQRNPDKSYIPYDKYPPFSMTTVSSHDCDTLRMWWKNSPEDSAIFAEFKGWAYEPKLSYEQLLTLLQDAHHTPSYFHINLLQEYLSLFPELIWGDGEEERINIPGTILPTNWTYRFRPFLEEMTEHRGLTDAIERILHE